MSSYTLSPSPFSLQWEELESARARSLLPTVYYGSFRRRKRGECTNAETDSRARGFRCFITRAGGNVSHGERGTGALLSRMEKSCVCVVFFRVVKI